MQQVNLYKDILKHGQTEHYVVLGFRVLGLCALLVAAVSGYAAWQLQRLEREVVHKRAEVNSLQAQLDGLMANRPTQEVDKGLVEEVNHWQASLDELTQALKFMAPSEQRATGGFAKFFEALARQSIPAVWLTRISIAGQVQAVNLEGSTFKPDQIPLFLQKLQREAAFSGKTFAQLTLEPSEKIPQQTDFKLSAVVAKPDVAKPTR